MVFYDSTEEHGRLIQKINIGISYLVTAHSRISEYCQEKNSRIF